VTTFLEFKESSAVNILGNCPDSPQALQLLNDATRKLMRRGDFSETVVPIRVCVYFGCTVFPRYVGSVRKMNICNCPVDMSNFWYSFQSRQCGCRSSCAAIDFGTSPVFSDIAGEGRLVRAYARCQKDLGKTITIFGVDNFGQTLHTRDSEGNWSEGITLTLAKPFASTSVYVRQITRLLKDKTQCPTDVYAYDVANDVLEAIGHYDGSETNPDYYRMQLNSHCSPAGCNGLKSITALVKLRFIPVENDSDLVLINNVDALKLMIQTMKYSDEGDLYKANAYEIDAIRELNAQLRDDFPLDHVPIQTFSSFGSGRQHCF